MDGTFINYGTVDISQWNGTLPSEFVNYGTVIDDGIALPGDVDGNGEVDIVDALLVAQYYVNLDPVVFNPNVADVDLDGEISIIDALLIAQYYVGLIPTLPV